MTHLYLLLLDAEPSMWLDLVKTLSLPAIFLFALSRYLTRRDKAQDEEKKAQAEVRSEEKTASKLKAEAAERERTELRDKLHDLTNRVTVMEGRATSLAQSDEQVKGDLHALRSELTALSSHVNKNEMNIENVKAGLSRIENTFTTLLSKLLDK